MTDRKKVLWIAVLGTGILGFAFALIPFFGAMKPPANAGEGLPHIDISDLAIGGHLFHDLDDESWIYSTRLLVVRYSDSQYYVYYMLRNEAGDTMLPDLRWWRAGWPCKRFGFEHPENAVGPNSVLRCHESDIEYGGDLAWRITGEAINHNYDNMESVDFSIEGKYLIAWKDPVNISV